MTEPEDMYLEFLQFQKLPPDLAGPKPVLDPVAPDQITSDPSLYHGVGAPALGVTLPDPVPGEPVAEEKGLLGDIGDGIRETIATVQDAPNALSRGAARGILEAVWGAGILDDKQMEHFRGLLDLFSQMAADEGVNETASGMLEGVGQIAPVALPVFKVLKVAGMGRAAAAVIAEGLGGAFAFNPDDPNLANMAQEFMSPQPGGQLFKALEIMATNPDDPAWQNRARNAIQDSALGLAFEALLKIPGAARAMVERFREGKSPVPMGNSIEDVSRDGPLGPAAAGDPVASGEVLGEAAQATDLSDIGTFSAVSRAVKALPQEKGSGEQMRAMIAKGEGVKAEEMAWIGLDEFLAGKKSVTKQEIDDYVSANEIQIEEVVKGKQERSGNVRVALIDGEHHLLQDTPDGSAVHVLDTYPGDAQGALDAARSEMNANRELTDTKFAEYVLPGGENYREVLLKLPETRGSTISNAESARLDELADKRIETGFGGLTDAEQDEYISLVGKSEDKGQFRGGHFDEPNVLAHIRLNDRVGPNGERILFIEEVQSDWHQAGRKQGYQGGSRFAGKLSAKEMDGGIGWEIRDENGTFVINVLKTEGPGRIQFEPAGAGTLEQATIATADDALSVAQRRIDNPDVGPLPRDDRVPDAPLKKTWHETAFRRVARMAAEEGYDAISWTPGKVQNDRYSLSNHVEQISVTAVNESSRAVVITAKPGSTISQTFKMMVANDGTVTGQFDANQFTGKTIDEVVGKEMASKIMEEGKPRVFSGLDLEIGGEGMKGFYDKMLKGYAQKWGKKFGSKVSLIEGVIAEHFTEVWTMPITPKMRDSVMKKGVSLFGAGAGAAVATQEGDR